MNKLTRQIRSKGYTLQEFCESIGRCLRWYRTHADQSNAQNESIIEHINQLENKK